MINSAAKERIPSLNRKFQVLASRYRLAIWIVSLILLSDLLLSVIGPDSSTHASIGFILGTLFGHTSTVAAWTAFGPLRLMWRVPLAMVWLGSLPAAIATQMKFSGSRDEKVLTILVICVLGQWLAVQFVFWGLVWTRGWRLRRQDEAAALDPRSRQFGIGQLMIFTTMVGFFLGLGRVAITLFPSLLQLDLNGETLIFAYLTVSAVVMTLPLVLACILRRFALPAVSVVLLLIMAGTAVQLPLMTVLNGGRGPPEIEHFIWINIFTCIWILAFTAIVRWHGYFLSASKPSNAAAVDP